MTRLRAAAVAIAAIAAIDARPPRRTCATLLLVIWLVWPTARGIAAEPTGSATSREALTLCNEAQSEANQDDEALLDRSLVLADQAIAADGHDALAYFARFCALGEQARRSGASLWSLFNLGAIREAVDRTLQLAPDFPDALLGKGALLCSLPSLLGGDVAEGERLVRRALEIEPDYVGARLFLAETLLDRGDRNAARAEAELALAAAERKKDGQRSEKARALLAKIGPADG